MKQHSKRATLWSLKTATCFCEDLDRPYLVTSINMLYRNSLSARLTVIVCLAVPLGFGIRETLLSFRFVSVYRAYIYLRLCMQKKTEYCYYIEHVFMTCPIIGPAKSLDIDFSLEASSTRQKRSGKILKSQMH